MEEKTFCQFNGSDMSQEKKKWWQESRIRLIEYFNLRASRLLKHVGNVTTCNKQL